MARLLLVLLAAVSLTACGSPSESDFVEPQAQAAQPAVCSTTDLNVTEERLYEGVLHEFSDMVEVAGITEKGDVPPLIGDMQRLRSEFRREVWPSCMAEVKALYLTYIEETIDGFLALMRPGGDADVSRYQAAASAALAAAEARWMERMDAGA